MGMVAILGDINHLYTCFHSPFHGASTWNLASISLAVSKEKKLENVSALEPKSVNDLDRCYS